MLEKLIGYRKLLIALLCFGTTTVLFLCKVLSESAYIELNKFVIPAFLAANIGEYLLNKTQEK